MITYFIPLILLAILAYIENLTKFSLKIKNKYFYSFIFLFFIFFIGLRYQIGCDWDVYKINFNIISSNDFFYILKNQKKFFDLGYSVLAKFISLKFDYSMLIFVYGLFFTLPLFYFCANIKRTYLSLMISYPYFILVVGMGPIRQASAIAFLMLTFIFIAKRKINLIYFSSISSLLFHNSAVVINALIFSKLNLFSSLNSKKKVNYYFYFLIIAIFLYNSPFIFNKLYSYITYYNSPGVNPAKGVFFVWLINFFPSIIFLSNYSKFNLEISLKKVLLTFSFSVIAIFPLIFLNSVITYRFLLYFFPSSIYITSYIPEIEFLKIKQTSILYSLILLCFFSLFAWLKYAYHSYCWLPYQNILFF